jgi:protein-tyrosine-phosphatase
VQSAGVKGDREIDGFAITVCREVGVELSRHRTRSFDDLMEWGDDLDSYDLIVALSPAAQRRALEYTRFYSLEVEYWQTMDPSGFGDNRDEKLKKYRTVRNQIVQKIKERFVEK